MGPPIRNIAVAYLCRGADLEWRSSCERFIGSYRRYRAGAAHSLSVIFKGFSNPEDLNDAKTLFDQVPCRQVFLGDANLDIGAYIEWSNLVDDDTMCVLTTSSEILAEDWLLKMAVNLAQPKVGLVGATASYESNREPKGVFPAFPNIHIRSNAFMVRRDLFCSLTKGHVISNKLDAWLFESGPHSLTRKILKSGRGILVVGSNGRGYSPKWWPISDTFKLGRQGNLLIADKQTRSFEAYNWEEKREVVVRSWGRYILEVDLLR